MPAMVSGIYKDGKIELLETPDGVPEGRVRVFLMEEKPKPEPRYLVRGKYPCDTRLEAFEEEPKPEPRYLEFGKYKGEKDTTLEDFKEAEWHGEAEFDDLYGE
jgi:hypothetical protein